MKCESRGVYWVAEGGLEEPGASRMSWPRLFVGS